MYIVCVWIFVILNMSLVLVCDDNPAECVQELRCREEELKRAALEQKSHEEFLRLREQQLAQWEQDVFERELSLLILHLNHNQKPNVKKRKGTFKKHKLKVKNGEKISMPQGEPSRQIKLMIIITLSLLTSWH